MLIFILVIIVTILLLVLVVDSWSIQMNSKATYDIHENAKNELKLESTEKSYKKSNAI